MKLIDVINTVNDYNTINNETCIVDSKLSTIINTLSTTSNSINTTNGVCTLNTTIAATKEALQENDTFIKRKQIDGTYKYYWSDTFVNKLITSLSTGEYENFGTKEKTIAENYVLFLINGPSNNMQEYIIPLDTWIGELK